MTPREFGEAIEQHRQRGRQQPAAEAAPPPTTNPDSFVETLRQWEADPQQRQSYGVQEAQRFYQRYKRVGLSDREIDLVAGGRAKLDIPDISGLTARGLSAAELPQALVQYRQQREELKALSEGKSADPGAFRDFAISAAKSLTFGYNPFNLPQESGKHKLAEIAGFMAGAAVPGLGLAKAVGPLARMMPVGSLIAKAKTAEEATKITNRARGLAGLSLAGGLEGLIYSTSSPWASENRAINTLSGAAFAPAAALGVNALLGKIGARWANIGGKGSKGGPGGPGGPKAGPVPEPPQPPARPQPPTGPQRLLPAPTSPTLRRAADLAADSSVSVPKGTLSSVRGGARIHAHVTAPPGPEYSLHGWEPGSWRLPTAAEVAMAKERVWHGRPQAKPPRFERGRGWGWARPKAAVAAAPPVTPTAKPMERPVVTARAKPVERPVVTPTPAPKSKPTAAVPRRVAPTPAPAAPRGTPVRPEDIEWLRNLEVIHKQATAMQRKQAAGSAKRMSLRDALQRAAAERAGGHSAESITPLGTGPGGEGAGGVRIGDIGGAVKADMASELEGLKVVGSAKDTVERAMGDLAKRLGLGPSGVVPVERAASVPGRGTLDFEVVVGPTKYRSWTEAASALIPGYDPRKPLTSQVRAYTNSLPPGGINVVAENMAKTPTPQGQAARRALRTPPLGKSKKGKK